MQQFKDSSKHYKLNLQSQMVGFSADTCNTMFGKRNSVSHWDYPVNNEQRVLQKITLSKNNSPQLFLSNFLVLAQGGQILSLFLC
jgi:hypothetical protein